MNSFTPETTQLAGVPGLATSEASALELARNQTATVEIPSVTPRNNVVDVTDVINGLGGNDNCGK